MGESGPGTFVNAILALEPKNSHKKLLSNGGIKN
jgi:hypothetical protein